MRADWKDINAAVHLPAEAMTASSLMEKYVGGIKEMVAAAESMIDGLLADAGKPGMGADLGDG